jgi:hypothetical protein
LRWYAFLDDSARCWTGEGGGGEVRQSPFRPRSAPSPTRPIFYATLRPFFHAGWKAQSFADLAGNVTGGALCGWRQPRRLFFAVLRAVRLRCLFSVLCSMKGVSASRMGVVSGLLVMSGVMMLGRLAVVPSRVAMMFRGLLMVFRCLLRHGISSKDWLLRKPLCPSFPPDDGDRIEVCANSAFRTRQTEDAVPKHETPVRCDTCDAMTRLFEKVPAIRSNILFI